MPQNIKINNICILKDSEENLYKQIIFSFLIVFFLGLIIMYNILFNSKKYTTGDEKKLSTKKTYSSIDDFTKRYTKIFLNTNNCVQVIPIA